uniref:G domain-containing protein n=1 Tax=Mastacembelus armatus TaxID=205130 RepID=A0A3Q3MID3_9TELE
MNDDDLTLYFLSALRNPWRNICWGNKWKDLQYVKNYQPQTKAVSHVRVLLYGPVGAGKSSFISSVTSVLRGRMANVALVGANNADQSITKHKEVRGNFYPFVFNDIMGLEEKTGQGVSVEDIKLALKGHVKDGYKFNPVSSLTPEDPGYNSSPSPDDRVHVLVWVCSANTPNVTPAILQKMRDVREAASDMNIPQLVLVTKVDEACAETEKDLKNIYKSKHLKKKFHESLGVPLNCFFPVKNYSKEISLNDDVDSLILSALRVMIDFGDDFIETM